MGRVNNAILRDIAMLRDTANIDGDFSIVVDDLPMHLNKNAEKAAAIDAITTRMMQLKTKKSSISDILQQLLVEYPGDQQIVKYVISNKFNDESNL